MIILPDCLIFWNLGDRALLIYFETSPGDPPARNFPEVTLIIFTKPGLETRLFIEDYKEMEPEKCRRGINDKCQTSETCRFREKNDNDWKIHRIADMPVQSLDHQQFWWINRGKCPFSMNCKSPTAVKQSNQLEYAHNDVWYSRAGGFRSISEAWLL